jgi:hypothetical protein
MSPQPPTKPKKIKINLSLTLSYFTKPAIAPPACLSARLSLRETECSFRSHQNGRGKKTGERRNTDLSTAPDVTKTIEKHEYLLSTATTSSCLSYTEAKRNQDKRSRARQA